MDLDTLTLEAIDNMTVEECQVLLDTWPKTPSGQLKGTRGNPAKGGLGFALRGKVKHEGRYKYREVVYINAHTKVSIICLVHGVFMQVPCGHLEGKGCSKCSQAAKADLDRDSAEGFIAKAKSVHGDRYTYSNVSYINNHTKVYISCVQHGDFLQTPNSHLNGSGCKECSKVASRGSTSDFIQKSKKIHGDVYDYSRVAYSTNKIKVEIVCPVHGSFYQQPCGHLRGNGCPQCTTTSDTVYLWGVEGTSTYKLGVSGKSRYTKRVNKVADAQVVVPNILAFATVGHKLARDYEKRTHDNLREAGYQSTLITSGEGYTEFFDLPDDIVEELLKEINNAGK